MKTEISRDSYHPEKRYSGLYQQQGRILTDADWNELVDILKGRLNEALKDVIGNGSPLHRNMVNNGITPPKLEWGVIYVDGIQALARPDKDAVSPVDFDYGHQEDFPQPPPLPISPANYVVYADVWERTVTQLMDERLRDIGLHGADTCTRKQVMAQIKWCLAEVDPESAAENPRKGDSRVTITLLKKSTEPDPCDPCAKQLDVESSIGNYLFRVEVHDVKGAANNPDEITLKWSAENGAIQSGVVDGDVQAHFKAGNNWVYEFFDQSSERHLGVHLDNSWQPVRAEMSETFVVPSDAEKPNQYVRRWDGFCRLKKNAGNWVVEQQYGNEEGRSFVAVAGNAVTIELSALRLLFEFDRGVVAGDHWLAEVRESAHKPDDILISTALPVGIEHHYVTLGKVVAGVLQDNSEADRKYAFPPLTEMTHMFIAGGDGQEVVPGKALPQPLCVAVGNGEWPVMGAQVRFQTVAKDETLTPLSIVSTDSNGVAKYWWTPSAALDAFLKVKATLVDPNEPGVDLDLPPLYFSANLVSADQVAYEPLCLPDGEADTVHHLLLGSNSGRFGESVRLKESTPKRVSLSRKKNRLGADNYYTVKEVLDALLCEFGAAHLPYEEPRCVGIRGMPTVKSLLDSLDNNNDGHTTVKDVLDTLLCRLTAEHIPYNSSIKAERWNDINSEEETVRPSTVQAAIDDLVDNLHSEDIKYSLPVCDGSGHTLKEYLMPLINHIDNDDVNQYRINELWNALLCHLKADMIPLNKTDDNLCPSLKNDPEVNTVQDALKVLCDQETGGGGCCTITISPGDDIEEKLTDFSKFAMLSTERVDAHICIANGNYLVRNTIRIENCGHITFQGCGDGSFIEAPQLESVLIFEGCKSVIVRDLSLRSGALESKGAVYDHLNGALTVRDVDKVVIENSTLMCAAGDKKMGSCLTVFHSVKTASVLISGCRLKPGARQVGMLLVNVDRARIDGNEVKVRRSNKKHTFRRRLQDRGFRLSIRKNMLIDVEVVTGTQQPERQNIVEIAYGEDKKIRWETQPELVDAWVAYFNDFPLPADYNDRDLVRYVKKQADKILLDPTVKENIFNSWINGLKPYLPAIAEQGIVCAGRVANDVIISGNTIIGVNQGIHIGLSHRRSGVDTDNEPDIAGRVMISGNRVVNFQSVQALRGRHGIYIGNVDCLHIENNHLKLETYLPPNATSVGTGIHMFGYFDDLIQVRGNRIAGYTTGIYVKAVNSLREETLLWQVENNLLAHGSLVLKPKLYFITGHNISY